MFASKSRIALAGMALLGLGATSAYAADPFYEGKTVTFLVGAATGGGSDIDCRLLAQYMPKYIPGNPTIIVKSMVSADNLLATNFVGKEAKNDGLTLRCGGWNFTAQLFKDAGLQVDMTKFNFIAGEGVNQMFFARKDVPPGINTPDDIYKAQGLVFGGTSVSGQKDIGDRLILDVMGIKGYKYVTGFAGEGAVRAGLQQKFVNLEGDSMQGYYQVTYPTLVKTGVVTPLFQSGGADQTGNLTIRSPMAPDIPTLIEAYTARNGKPPSGISWDLTKILAGSLDVATYALALPPGAPPEAIKAMRESIPPLNQDADFVSASEKVRGPGARERTWEIVTDSVNKLINMDPKQLAYFNDFIKQGQQEAQPKK